MEEGWGHRPGNRKEMHRSCQVIVLLTHGGQFENIMLVLFQIIDSDFNLLLCLREKTNKKNYSIKNVGA